MPHRYAHEGGDVLAHSTPVWKVKSNILVLARVPEMEGYEELWCRSLSPDLVEVCCIPFFVYGVSLGDVASINETANGQLMLAHVVRPSGRHTFRVSFLHSDDADHRIRHGMLGILAESAARREWHGDDLLAIDVPPETVEKIREALDDGYSSSKFDFEMANPPPPEES